MHQVSIGLPVYNGERYISETLDSLLAQTFEDYELIICDNASTDHTEQICRSYADNDNRIRYIRNAENLGAAKNYRLAFEYSSGEYFRWANYDDVFAPESLSSCKKILDQEPSVVLTYPKTILINEQGKIISEYEDNLHLQACKASERFAQVYQRIGMVNVIYGLMRADFLRQTGLLRNFPSGDIPLVAELALYGKFWEIPEFLFYRRLHPEASSSYKHDAQRTQAFFDPKIIKKASTSEWKHLWENYHSVIRAPLDRLEKLSLCYFIIRRGIWNRENLVKEFIQAIR